MPLLPDTKQEQFATLLSQGEGKAAAYLQAGYAAKNKNSAGASAARLLRDPKVAERVKELQEQTDESADISTGWVEKRLVRIVSIALGEELVPLLSKDGKRVLHVAKVDMQAANRALELLGKSRGMFIDRLETGSAGEFVRMSDDELRAFLASKLAARGLSPAAFVEALQTVSNIGPGLPVPTIEGEAL